MAIIENDTHTKVIFSWKRRGILKYTGGSGDGDSGGGSIFSEKTEESSFLCVWCFSQMWPIGFDIRCSYVGLIYRVANSEDGEIRTEILEYQSQSSSASLSGTAIICGLYM